MSVRIDDVWVKGETWSEIVTCTDAAGQNISVVSADYRLKTFETDVPVVQLTQSSGLTISGTSNEICTSIIETTAQASIEPGLYWRRLRVVDSTGAKSRQIHGFIEVLPED